ncbi:hypothetical protein ACFX2I_020155 [Malus domestica]
MASTNATSELRGVEKLVSSLDEIADWDASRKTQSSQERELPLLLDVLEAICVGPEHPRSAFDGLVMQMTMTTRKKKALMRMMRTYLWDAFP